MNRDKFIKDLLKYLRKLPVEERREIENYYNELFDESGILPNDEVPESFGTPKEIALDIMVGIKDDESDFKDAEVYKEKSKNNAIPIIILTILAAPIGIPLAAVIGIIFLSLVIVFCSVIFALAIGIIGLGVAIFTSSVSILSRILAIGYALIIVGLLILFIELFSFIIRKISSFISRKLRERRNSREK